MNSLNVAVYVWKRTLPEPHLERGRLEDIYYTPATSDTNDTTHFAHHVHLAYQSWRVYPPTFAPMALRTHDARLQYVAVASRGNDPQRPRERVRTYELHYEDRLRGPYLTLIVPYGRCTTTVEEQALGRGRDLYQLPSSQHGCSALPPTRFEYGSDITARENSWTSLNSPYDIDPHINQDGGLSTRFRLPHRCSNGVGDSSYLNTDYTSIVDVNRDGLPDLVQTHKSPRTTNEIVFINTLLPMSHWPPKEFDCGIHSRDPYPEDLLYDTSSTLQSALLSPRAGITVPGSWLHDSSLVSLHRSGTAKSYSDGFPRSYVALRPVEPAPDGRPRWHETKVTGGPLPTLPAPHLIGDLNGDGVADAIFVQTLLDDHGKVTNVDGTYVALSTRTSEGTIAPFSRVSKSNLYVELRERAPRYAALADMNGDGILDYVTIRGDGQYKGQFVYLPGHGNGNFGCTDDVDGCEVTEGTPGVHPKTGSVAKDVRLREFTGLNPRLPNLWDPVNDTPYEWERVHQKYQFGDINGDGRADLIIHDGLSIRIFINWDGLQLRAMRNIRLGGPYFPGFNKVFIADMDADGINDVVLLKSLTRPGDMLSGNHMPEDGMYLRLSQLTRSIRAPYGGLLEQIHHAGGSTTEFTYETIQKIQDRNGVGAPDSLVWPEDPADSATGPWKYRSPRPHLAVTQVITSTDAPAPYGFSNMTRYFYREPVFDEWRNQFRGFRRARVQREVGIVDTKYVFDGCLSEDNQYPNQRTCSNPEQDKYEAIQGLPMQVERQAANVRYESTTRYSYQVQKLGHQWVTYLSAVDTYLYDTDDFVPAPSYVSVGVANFADPRGVEAELVDDIAILRANAVRIRRRQQVDVERQTITDVWNDGQIDVHSGSAIDRPIHEHMDWVHIAGPGVHRVASRSTVFDGMGTTTSLLADSVSPPRSVSYTYDAIARLSSVRATVSGSLPLKRFHSSGKPTAPNPPSSDGVHVLQSYSYDVYGNVIRVVGADQQCEATTWLAPYHDLPASHTTYVDGCGSARHQTTEATFDRGLGVVTSTTSPNLAKSVFSYDALGRLQTVEGPHPYKPRATVPAVRFEYNPNLEGPIHWVKTTQLAQGKVAHTRWQYSNGLGHPMATLEQADPSAGDAGGWIVYPGPYLSRAHGKPLHTYRPWFYSGDPELFSWSTPVTEELSIGYDLWGRLRSVTSKGTDTIPTVLLRREYHALSIDEWDAENDHAGTAAYGAYSTITRNGHGRVVRVSKAGARSIETWFDYLPTGEVKALLRQSADGAYRRWRRFDSLGRVVENAEPNTSAFFTNSPGNLLQTWRYAYDLSGRLVGTSDARGCGKNLHYDGANRLIAEDFSPCEDHHSPYSPPDLGSGDGTEAYFGYDETEGEHLYPEAALGRLTKVADRGAVTSLAYDGRGRMVATQRRIVRPGLVAEKLSTRYTNHVFQTHNQFDDFDRVVRASSGADAPELLVGGESYVDIHYSARGMLTAIGGSYGDLLTDVRADADGFVTSQLFGDLAKTRVELAPDPNRRVASYRVTRSKGPWSAGPGYTPSTAGEKTFQGDLIHQTFTYDLVGNTTNIQDKRDPHEWPLGAKPTWLKRIDHDAHYRVVQTYSAHGDDDFVSPFAAEIAAGETAHVPHQRFPTRAVDARFRFDGFGNLLGDFSPPSHSFYDRGLVNVTLADGKPHQIAFADAADEGELAAHHDAAGNLVALDLERPKTHCLGPSLKCSQRFLYQWDEVGQLAAVSRWDYDTLQTVPIFPNPPEGTPEVSLRFAYSNGQRVLKHIVDTSGNSDRDRFVVDVFDSLRLSRTTYNEAANDFNRSADVQHLFLAGIAKVVHAPGLPKLDPAAGDRHVLLLVSDRIGSSNVVIDKATSELVEYREYQPYGATDYDYRPARWNHYREDLHFTGKEEDTETGLIYFGARYYSPYLQRFVSADPLTVHAWGGDPNPYAYVRGRVFDATDPFGLDGGCLGAEQCYGSGSGWSMPGVQIGFDLTEIFGGRNRTTEASASPSSGWGYGMPPPPTPAPFGSYANTAAANAAYDMFQSWWSAPGFMGGGLLSGGPPHPRLNSFDVMKGFWNFFAQTAVGLAIGPMAHIPTLGPAVVAAVSDVISFECGPDSDCTVGAGLAAMTMAAFPIGEGAAIGRAAGAAKGVVAGEAGSFGSLAARRVVGDGLTPHHMPQVALEFTSRAEGGALVMPQAEHALTRTFAGRGIATARQETGMAFRDVLARDIRDVRQIAGPKYDAGLRQLLRYYYENFPQLMAR